MIKKLWQRVSEIGIRDNMDLREMSRIRLVNRMVTIGMITMMFFIPVELSKGYFWTGMTLSAAFVCLFFSLFLNKIGRNNISGALSVGSVGLAITINAYLHRADIGSTYILLVMIGLPSLCIDIKHKWSILAIMISLAIMAFIIPAMNFASKGLYTLDAHAVSILYYSVIIDAIILMIGQVYIFYSEMEKRFNLFQENQEKLVSQAGLSDLGTMVAGIAHEINNPLAIIQANVERIDQKTKKEDCYETLIKKKTAAILRSSERISNITDGLRTIGKDDSDSPMTKVDLREIITPVMDLCDGKFSSSKIEVKLALDNKLGEVFARKVQIEQILLSIISNSIYAIQKQENPWIKVEVEERPDTVALRVIDSGLGIEQEISDKMMCPFFTTKDYGQGVGLGLSVAKSVMESHKGQLTYDDSHENTCFVLEFQKVA